MSEPLFRRHVARPRMVIVSHETPLVCLGWPPARRVFDSRGLIHRNSSPKASIFSVSKDNLNNDSLFSRGPHSHATKFSESALDLLAGH